MIFLLPGATEGVSGFVLGGDCLLLFWGFVIGRKAAIHKHPTQTWKRKTSLSFFLSSFSPSPSFSLPLHQQTLHLLYDSYYKWLAYLCTAKQESVSILVL